MNGITYQYCCRHDAMHLSSYKRTLIFTAILSEISPSSRIKTGEVGRSLMRTKKKLSSETFEEQKRSFYDYCLPKRLPEGHVISRNGHRLRHRHRRRRRRRRHRLCSRLNVWMLLPTNKILLFQSQEDQETSRTFGGSSATIPLLVVLRC